MYIIGSLIPDDPTLPLYYYGVKQGKTYTLRIRLIATRGGNFIAHVSRLEGNCLPTRRQGYHVSGVVPPFDTEF